MYISMYNVRIVAIMVVIVITIIVIIIMAAAFILFVINKIVTLKLIAIIMMNICIYIYVSGSNNYALKNISQKIGSYPDPRADPASRSSLEFCNLRHKCIGMQNWGCYFLDPRGGLGTTV